MNANSAQLGDSHISSHKTRSKLHLTKQAFFSKKGPTGESSLSQHKEDDSTQSRTVLRCKGKRAWATEAATALIVLQQAEEEFLESCFLASSACRLLTCMPGSPAGPCEIQRPFLSVRQLIKMLLSATEKRAASRKVPIRSSTHVDIMQS